MVSNTVLPCHRGCRLMLFVQVLGYTWVNQYIWLLYLRYVTCSSDSSTVRAVISLVEAFRLRLPRRLRVRVLAPFPLILRVEETRGAYTTLRGFRGFRYVRSTSSRARSCRANSLSSARFLAGSCKLHALVLVSCSGTSGVSFAIVLPR